MNRHQPHEKPDIGWHSPHPSSAMPPPPPPGISFCDRAKTLREHPGYPAVTAGSICSSSPEHHSAWVVVRYQLLTLSLPFVGYLEFFLPNYCCLGKSKLFPNPAWDVSPTADTIFLILVHDSFPSRFPSLER